MNDVSLKGKRFIALARCSTRGQAESSLDDQMRLIRRFAADNGMIEIAEIRLEGVSGSVAENLDRVIAGLIKRKAEANDYDVLVVQDASRFSRAGAGHSAKLRYDLERAAVEVISALGYVPKSDYGEVKDALDAVVARQQAKGIAAGVARGSMSAMAEGRQSHSSRTPYGLDKLYLSSDGRPLHVVRTNYDDGSQVRLHPTTGEVIDRYGRNEKTGTPAHYRKQRGERIIYIPGEPAVTQVVHEMYRSYFVDKRGYAAIAKELNGRGVASPTGRGWSVSSVRRIIANPVYSGKGISNRKTTAIFYCRAPDVPREAPKVRRTASGRPAETYRPIDEWVVIDYSQLKNYLPADIRDAAAAHHQAILDGLKDGRAVQPRDKHPDSSFLLKGILQTSDGHRMTGRRKGRRCRGRYYAAMREQSHPSGRPSARRLVRADAVEAVALYTLRCLLLAMPGLRDEFVAQTKAAVRGRAGDEQARDSLAAEIRRLDKRIAMVLDEFDGEDESAVRAKLADLKLKRREASDRLAGMQRPASISDEQIENMVDAMIAMYVEQADMLRELPAPHVRELLGSFVESMSVDLSTMRVDLVASVPPWGGPAVAKASESLGLACSSVYRAEWEAQLPAAARRRVWFILPPFNGRRRAA
jgi:hypothetical protein